VDIVYLEPLKQHVSEAGFPSSFSVSFDFCKTQVSFYGNHAFPGEEKLFSYDGPSPVRATNSACPVQHQPIPPFFYLLRLIVWGGRGHNKPIRVAQVLWNNYVMHLRIQDSFDRLGSATVQVEIPRAAWYASKSSEL
jgi:hypothetical protein